MRLRAFVPHDENEDIQVNQMDLYPDANAVEDADIFDENLPPTQEDNSDKEPQEETTEINRQTESPTFSDVYAPGVIARRASIKSDTPLGWQKEAITRTQLPPKEKVEDRDERVPCSLVAEVDQKYGSDIPAVSHNNTKRTMNIQAQTNNTTGKSRSTEKRYILRANPTPKKYTDFLNIQISDTRTALRPVGTRQHNSHQKSRKIYISKRTRTKITA